MTEFVILNKFVLQRFSQQEVRAADHEIWTRVDRGTDPRVPVSHDLTDSIYPRQIV